MSLAGLQQLDSLRHACPYGACGSAVLWSMLSWGWEYIIKIFEAVLVRTRAYMHTGCPTVSCHCDLHSGRMGPLCGQCGQAMKHFLRIPEGIHGPQSDCADYISVVLAENP